MIQFAQANEQIIGLIPHLIDKGVAILQYADDSTILQDDPDSARNLKLLLYLFEQMSGLKVNFQKSEMLMVLQDDEKGQSMLIFSIVSWLLGLLSIWGTACGSR